MLQQLASVISETGCGLELFSYHYYLSFYIANGLIGFLYLGIPIQQLPFVLSRISTLKSYLCSPSALFYLDVPFLIVWLFGSFTIIKKLYTFS